MRGYARVIHPAWRSSLGSMEQQVPLRWSEIARARGGTTHPEMQIEARMDAFHGDHWGEDEIGEYWSERHKWLTRFVEPTYLLIEGVTGMTW